MKNRMKSRAQKEKAHFLHYNRREQLCMLNSVWERHVWPINYDDSDDLLEHLKVHFSQNLRHKNIENLPHLPLCESVMAVFKTKHVLQSTFLPFFYNL